MALHFLVDGYNVIHQIPQLDQYRLEEQRTKFIRLLENTRPQGSIKNKVCVVFDGQGGIRHDAISNLIEVLFSVNQSADEKIKQMVEQSKNPKNIIVVTNDRGIQIVVRKTGAKIMSVEEFLAKSEKRPARKSTTKASPSKSNKNISHTDEYNINKEMSDVWLKKRSSNFVEIWKLGNLETGKQVIRKFGY